jgi:hypothetical protein
MLRAPLRNQAPPCPALACPPGDTNPGRADVAALEWGAEGYMDAVAGLAAEQPIDIVVRARRLRQAAGRRC